MRLYPPLNCLKVSDIICPDMDSDRCILHVNILESEAEGFHRQALFASSSQLNGYSRLLLARDCGIGYRSVSHYFLEGIQWELDPSGPSQSQPAILPQTLVTLSWIELRSSSGGEQCVDEIEKSGWEQSSKSLLHQVRDKLWHYKQEGSDLGSKMQNIIGSIEILLDQHEENWLSQSEISTDASGNQDACSQESAVQGDDVVHCKQCVCRRPLIEEQ